ncbi:hypothetical protein [Enterococcus villorum]|nr:hypothetical protein [Enterococcus villorum]
MKGRMLILKEVFFDDVKNAKDWVIAIHQNRPSIDFIDLSKTSSL